MSEAILKARARVLARPLVTAAPRDRHRALVLVDGAASFAVDLDACGEVLSAPAITPLPHAPPHVSGLALVRGRVVACFRLTLAPAIAGPKKLVLLGDSAAGDLAIVVDDASNVVDFSDDDVAAAFADDAGRLPLRGVLPGGRLLLDGPALGRDPRFFFPATVGM